jgi:branched-chain amino acid transport system substrate-binding protein
MPLPLALALALVLALAGGLAAGCMPTTRTGMSTRAVTIGFLAATSGAAAYSGVDATRGAQLAVDVVNQAYPDISVPLGLGEGLPRLGGATLTLVTGDTQGAPAEAANQATTLVEAKSAVAVVVSGPADVTASVANQTQRLRVPLLDASSSADFLTELGMLWYFRVTPTDRMLADVVFNLVQRQLAGVGNPRVAVLTETDADATDPVTTATELQDLLARAGYQMALRRDVSPSGDDATVQTARHAGAQALQATAADVVLALASTAAGADDEAQTVAQMPHPVPVIGLGPGFEALGAAPAGATVLRAAPWSAEFAGRSPTGHAVTSLYQRRFGTPMTRPAAEAFTATMTLATAINAAGSSQPTAIRTALRQLWVPATDVVMPWNGIQFDADGQNHLAAGVVEEWVGAGFRVVFPRELAVATMAWATGGSRQ